MAGAPEEAAVTKAIRASGVIVRVKLEDFLVILNKQEKPLVVPAMSRFLVASYQYFMPYKRLVFYTKSKNPLMLPHSTELVHAKSTWIPRKATLLNYKFLLKQDLHWSNIDCKESARLKERGLGIGSSQDKNSRATRKADESTG